MSVTVNITVEDIATRLSDGYEEIALQSASAPDGSFSAVTSEALVADQVYYEIEDSSGTPDTWYRYRFTGTGGGAPTSDYSNPFSQGGLSRKAIRQETMSRYKLGMVFTSHSSGNDANTVATIDRRLNSSIYSTRRGVNTWLMPNSGAQSGIVSRVASVDPTTSPATFDVSPAWSSSPGDSLEFEWHTVLDPEDFNDCINAALGRYLMLERVPIVGAGESEIDLSFLPWLFSRSQVCGLWYYPISNYPERQWGTDGRWWNIRTESGATVLMTSPALQETDTVYLEALRYLDPLYTDTSLTHERASIQFLAALVYDEVLNFLQRPGVGGASTDIERYRQDQVRHRIGTLRRYRAQYLPRPRIQRRQTPEAAVNYVPWSAR